MAPLKVPKSLTSYRLQPALPQVLSAAWLCIVSTSMWAVVCAQGAEADFAYQRGGARITDRQLSAQKHKRITLIDQNLLWFHVFFFCGLNLLFRNLSIHSLCSFYIVFVFFPNQFLRLLCILALYHVWQVYLPNVLLSVGFYPTVLISLVIKYIFTSLSFLFSLSLHLQITLLVSYIVILGLFYCLRSYTICQLNLY